MAVKQGESKDAQRRMTDIPAISRIWMSIRLDELGIFLSDRYVSNR
jgi:hypothetical protein